MNKEKAEVTEIIDTDGNVLENDFIIVFRKPYTFEGQEYKQIDLSGLDDLSAADMIAANKVMERSGSTSFLPEMSLQYACIIAAKATKQPVEFFNGLHPKEAIRVKNKVVSFFYGQD